MPTGRIFGDIVDGTVANTFLKTDAAGSLSFQFPQQDLYKVFAQLGSGVKYMTIGSVFGEATNNIGFADNFANYNAIWVAETFTPTGVAWYQTTQGNYTSDQNNKVGVFSESGGTLTKLAESTNDGNLWKGASGTFQKKAFNAAVPLTGGRTYFIATLYNSSAQVTAPVIRANNDIVQNLSALDFTNSNKLTGFKNATNDLPASIAMSTINGSGAANLLLFLYV
jgi:hypothetical protein